jgi:hypothetical protein
MRFNPPPNWPTPPAGWSPPAGWTPDPSWPPPPPGWRLWVEDVPLAYPGDGNSYSTPTQPPPTQPPPPVSPPASPPRYAEFRQPNPPTWNAGIPARGPMMPSGNGSGQLGQSKVLRWVIAAGFAVAVIFAINLIPKIVGGLFNGGEVSATCDDYARADFDEQGDIQRDLLKAHDLDPSSISNTAGLTGAIEDACGGELTNHRNGHAARNGSSKIDDLINWRSGTWPR